MGSFCKVLQLHTLLKKKGNTSGRKVNKIWEDKGSGFYNRLMKSWLQKHGLELYSIHYEGKSVDAERYITT